MKGTCQTIGDTDKRILSWRNRNIQKYEKSYNFTRKKCKSRDVAYLIFNLELELLLKNRIIEYLSKALKNGKK